MMGRRIRFIWAMAMIGILFFLPAGAFAQTEDAVPAEIPSEVPLVVPPGGFVHTVVQGDTLWDLSAKHLGSPWKWTEIWELNRFVTNPHYIYPGIKIVIVPSGPRETELLFGSSAESAAKGPAGEPVPSAMVSAPKTSRDAYLDITPEQMIRVGQFLREKPEGIGKVDAGKEPKEGFSAGDRLFLTLDREVSEGQLLAVYRIRGPLSVPGGKVSSGYIKYLIGVLQVVPAEDGRVVANVRESFEDITRNDIISDEIPAFFRVKIVPGAEDVHSTVIANQLINEELATGDCIFIDSGSASGVEVGNVFRIYRAIELEAGAATTQRSNMKIEVARAVVVRVDEEFSALYVSGSVQSFDVGSQARRGIPAK